MSTERWKDKDYYSKSVMTALSEMLDVGEFGNKSSVKKLYTMGEIFEAVLEYEGIIGYGIKIREWIKEIYGIDLDKVEE